MNRGWRFCRPLPYRLATAPLGSDRPVVGWLETGRATCGDSVAWSWTVCEVGLPTVAPSPAIESGGWSGKRDSNPRLRPWQGRTLPLSYSRPRPNYRTVIVIQPAEAAQPDGSHMPPSLFLALRFVLGPLARFLRLAFLRRFRNGARRIPRRRVACRERFVAGFVDVDVLLDWCRRRRLRRVRISRSGAHTALWSSRPV